MREPDRDLVHLFVRDLDTIELPAPGRWRPAPRKESPIMRVIGLVAPAVAVAALLVLALVWSAGSRGPSGVVATPGATPSVSATPAPSASAGATGAAAASASPSPTASGPAGTITGGLGYPSEMVPRLEVYAISVNDPSVWFSVKTPQFGGGSVTPMPRPAGATPEPPPSYSLTGVAPGTYYVLAYLDDPALVGGAQRPGLYSRYTVDCIMASKSTTPAPACAKNDHSLIPVTVRADQTTANIDVRDWYYGQEWRYPSRPAR